MTNAALFVDLPNLYSHLLESKIAEPRLLRDYFLEWFDFDRLSESITGDVAPTWVFYSGQKFGRKPNRIEGEHLREFITRSNRLEGVTARDANIPGEQREPASYQCPKCNHEGIVIWESEKGIDTSLIVHLFDTMDSWDTAYLLSGDADFVPCVTSLRRRGKIVTGAGFSSASSALVRECYHYIDLTDSFFRNDVGTYKLFREDGLIKRWLFDTFVPQKDISNPPKKFSLSVEWQETRPSYMVFQLKAGGFIDLETRLGMVKEYNANFPGFITKVEDLGQVRLAIPEQEWEGANRRFYKFISSLEGTSLNHEEALAKTGYVVEYRYNEDSGQYERR